MNQTHLATLLPELLKDKISYGVLQQQECSELLWVAPFLSSPHHYTSGFFTVSLRLMQSYRHRMVGGTTGDIKIILSFQSLTALGS